ncbi:MAG: hypothetical protein QOH85_1747, partial [Acidobacteriaceae bacterium]|nr:hypothetical protein [Acidobacteriaceae bacterium]
MVHSRATRLSLQMPNQSMAARPGSVAHRN